MKSQKPLSFEIWSELFQEEIDIDLAENGSDRELDFDPEREYEKRYNKYLESFDK